MAPWLRKTCLDAMPPRERSACVSRLMDATAGDYLGQLVPGGMRGECLLEMEHAQRLRVIARMPVHAREERLP